MCPVRAVRAAETGPRPALLLYVVGELRLLVEGQLIVALAVVHDLDILDLVEVDDVAELGEEIVDLEIED